MTPTEMELRVAKALANSVYCNLWSILALDKKADFIGHARAAIRAMRKPTPEMYEALSATGQMWKDLNSEKVWKAMIDAASPTTDGDK